MEKNKPLVCYHLSNFRRLHCYLIMALGLPHSVARIVQLAVHEFTMAASMDQADWLELLLELLEQHGWSIVSHHKDKWEVMFFTYQKQNHRIFLTKHHHSPNSIIMDFDFSNPKGVRLFASYGWFDFRWQNGFATSIANLRITSFLDIVFAILRNNEAEIKALTC